MPPPVSLVVTDLDGTLWHRHDEVHEDTVAAVAKVAELGVPLLVATGRRLRTTRDPLALLGLAPPAVVLNGALGLDLSSGGRFHRAAYPPDQAAEVLAAFTSVGLSPVVYVDHPRVDVFLGPAPSTHAEHAAMLRPTAGVDDLARVVAEETVLGFGLIGIPVGSGEAAARAVGDLAELHLDRSLDHPGLSALTVAPRGQSKWDGVLAYCASRGLDATRVLALADGPNDVELLDHAMLRLVPANAHHSARRRADHLIAPAADGGWAEVVRFLG
jgi:hydroxymethylpyrimidine pyrophosphatase-like HAD family hydrolase